MDTGITTINPQLNIQKKNHNAFILMLGMFLLFIFARNVLGISLPVIIFLGWFCLTALVADRDEILVLLMICFPCANAFQYKYGILACIVIYAIKFKEDINLNMCVLPLITMMVWELIHGLFYDFSFGFFIRDFPELIMVTFLMCIKNRKTNCEFICRVYGYTTVIVAIFILFAVLKNNHFDINALFEGNNFRFGVTNKEQAVSGLNYNPNVFGTICNIAIISLLVIRYMGKNNLLDNVAVLVLVLIGGLSISRTFIFLCISIFATFSFLGNRNGKGRIKTIFIIGVLFLVAIVTVAKIMPSVYDSFVERFSVDDITNGRGQLSDIYDEHIYSKWRYALFGIGLQDVIAKMSQIHGLVINVPHNGFQELIVVWGYPGLCMFFALILCMIHSAGKNVNKYRAVNFIPFMFFMVTASVGQLITAGNKLIMFAFIYLILSTDFSKEEM